MLVHSVYFWLKDGLTDQQISEFEEMLDSLKNISCAQAVYTGTPAVTDRPVIDRSYSYALTVIFEDMEKHDLYQVDPLHKAFLEKCSPMFEKVLIYDAD